MVPSYSRKAISGWSNHPCTVTSHKMNENEMGYRGSKSEIQNPQPNKISVKEQRVDGSWFLAKMARNLRCTLMGREICYPIKIPSKQSNKLSYSTLSCNPKLNPWFVTGFSDAESCFSISIYSDSRMKTKWRISPLFVIKLHIKDIAILEAIKYTLGVGVIRNNYATNSVQYRVESIKNLQVIVDHFDKYQLISAKVSDYLLFKQCFELIKKGEHLTEEGVLQLVRIKSSLNWGLSSKLKEAFPNIIPALGPTRARGGLKRPDYLFKGITDPYWVAGFTSGEGSFHLVIRDSNTNNGKDSVSMRFSINLNIREIEIIKGLVTFFKLNRTETIETEATKNFYISPSGKICSSSNYKGFRYCEHNYSVFRKISDSGCKKPRFCRL
uniref:LAGLIDADG homing endonuclease n=1 Tax=Termitomyces sp. TaxID=1916073 RepID=A0A386TYC5_9AGAR|nr:LAGLIDADG homing endonuclease [Termitomyces sp.]AYE93258.1 LAGLIDADG homing endonuclease [Termitomyces sp.]